MLDLDRMDVQQLIKYAGGTGKLAAKLGIKHNTVSSWKRSGFLPAHRAIQIGHALEIPMWELTPLVKKDNATGQRRKPAKAA
jgi:DNA-binding transcriptional regulator YdaS (Cro superfamily)